MRRGPTANGPKGLLPETLARSLAINRIKGRPNSWLTELLAAYVCGQNSLLGLIKQMRAVFRARHSSTYTLTFLASLFFPPLPSMEEAHRVWLPTVTNTRPWTLWSPPWEKWTLSSLRRTGNALRHAKVHFSGPGVALGMYNIDQVCVCIGEMCVHVCACLRTVCV